VVESPIDEQSPDEDERVAMQSLKSTTVHCSREATMGSSKKCFQLLLTNLDDVDPLENNSYHGHNEGTQSHTTQYSRRPVSNPPSDDRGDQTSHSGAGVFRTDTASHGYVDEANGDLNGFRCSTTSACLHCVSGSKDANNHDAPGLFLGNAVHLHEMLIVDKDDDSHNILQAHHLRNGAI
jgi:hypothetical protein